MNRQQFLRLLVATPVLTCLFGTSGQARAQSVDDTVVITQAHLDELRAADRGVDVAYDKCATGAWAMVYQREYLQAALKAARAYEQYEPDNAYGLNYYRLAIDIATDMNWEPRSAKREDVRLLQRAAEYTRKHPNGPQHVARANALLKKIRQQAR